MFKVPWYYPSKEGCQGGLSLHCPPYGAKPDVHVFSYPCVSMCYVCRSVFRGLRLRGCAWFPAGWDWRSVQVTVWVPVRVWRGAADVSIWALMEPCSVERKKGERWSCLSILYVHSWVNHIEFGQIVLVVQITWKQIIAKLRKMIMRVKNISSLKSVRNYILILKTKSDSSHKN